MTDYFQKLPSQVTACVTHPKIKVFSVSGEADKTDMASYSLYTHPTLFAEYQDMNQHPMLKRTPTSIIPTLSSAAAAVYSKVEGSLCVRCV